MARTIAKWGAISLLILGAAMLLGAAAIVAWARHLTGPTRGGISAGEYIGAWQLFRFVLYPGAVGCVALLATALYWSIGLRAPARPGEGRRRVGVSLVLVPLWLALLCAAALLLGADPAMWHPFPRR